MVAAPDGSRWFQMRPLLLDRISALQGSTVPGEEMLPELVSKRSKNTCFQDLRKKLKEAVKMG